ncbi:MAG: glucose-1-phosphate adenylyltransferase, partial [Clostridia bacterium]|nr:glucose-1-phosphate adenylyltransferase [Clostridia bacterium]
DTVLFSGAKVEKGADVSYSVIMPGAVIKSGAVVKYSIVGQDAVIENGATVGASPEEFKEKIDDWGIATVGPNFVVGKDQTVKPKEMLEAK